MRSTDEQLAEIAKRATRMSAQAASRRRAALDALAAAACLILIAFVATTTPQLGAAPTGVSASQFGSLALTGGAVGYVLIGVLAFLLGVCITMLCIHLRNGRRG